MEAGRRFHGQKRTERFDELLFFSVDIRPSRPCVIRDRRKNETACPSGMSIVPFRKSFLPYSSTYMEAASQLGERFIESLIVDIIEIVVLGSMRNIEVAVLKAQLHYDLVPLPRRFPRFWMTHVSLVKSSLTLLPLTYKPQSVRHAGKQHARKMRVNVAVRFRRHRKPERTAPVVRFYDIVILIPPAAFLRSRSVYVCV